MFVHHHTVKFCSLGHVSKMGPAEPYFKGCVAERPRQTLNLNSNTSPSCTTYSFAFLPQLARFLRARFAAQRDVILVGNRFRARMKPRSKSLWISPAACGALAPSGKVQARASLGPAGEEGLEAQQA